MIEQEKIHDLFSLRSILSTDTASPTIETRFENETFIVNINDFIQLKYSQAKYGNEVNIVIKYAIKDIIAKREEIKSILYK